MRSSSRLRQPHRTLPTVGCEGFLDQGSLADDRYSGKTVQSARKEGAIVGCDFAGTVEKLGTAVQNSVRKVGDRVAGFVQGCKLLPVAFPTSRLTVNDQQSRQMAHSRSTWLPTQRSSSPCLQA